MSKGINRKRVGLVLGAGSIKCASAIGVYKVLVRHGIDIDLLVGCSGGSIYAGTIAIGLTSEEMEETTYKVWTKDLTSTYRLRSVFKLFFPNILGFNENFGLIDDRKVLDIFQDLYGDKTFADTHIPLHILATNFQDGEQLEISSGRLIDAIRASIAIPFIFEPKASENCFLLDGGLNDLMPIDIAIKEGADIIIAIGFELPLLDTIDTFRDYVIQVTSIMQNNLLKSNFAFHNLAPSEEILTIMPDFEERIGISDGSKIHMIIEKGEEAMEEQIPYLQKLLGMTTAG